MKRKGVVICCSVLLALIVALAVVLVALYFTVFRPRSPHVVATVVSTRLSDIRLVPPFALNLSFGVDVTVKNPNYAAFRYGDVVTGVTYHGAEVGQSVMPAGELGARATETVGAAVEVDAVKVVFTPDFLLDGLAGMLPFATTTTVAGKAMVLGTFKIRASSVVTCRVSTVPLTGESTSQCTSTVRVG